MTEQQPYEVLRRSAEFELRHYPTHVVAEVEVVASFDRAGNAAFRRLFRYISGANTPRRSVAMTAPVVQRTGDAGRASSETVRMTAPVVQRGPVAADPDDPHRYLVAFVLPADMTEDTAPVPTDPEVLIRTVPASLAAALRFSGSGSGAAFAKHARALRDAIREAGLTPVGTPRSARFDPPYKPWILRRNEVVQDVAEDGPIRT
ncbi:MAG: heme-binding protein [Acidobacteria bacterium]|nr:heme-binding protein [Acidobacteriota bacterium]